MDNAGTEIRGARRLVAACVVVLVVAGAGLVITARDVAHWIDVRDGEIEVRRVAAALAYLARERPGLPADELARRVADGFELADARVTGALPVQGAELGVSLLGGDGRHLVWRAPALGRETRMNFAPTRMPLILGCVLIVGLLLLRLERLARALDGQRRLADELAATDSLTRLGNRLAFDRGLARRLDDGRNFALVYIDLNGFKQVNDRFGHAAGDAVLRGVGVRLRRLAGENDAAFRLGGDEFAMLIADDGRSIARLARKIVTTVDDAYPVGNGEEAVVGVSVGVAIAPQDARSNDALMLAADGALYTAKAIRGSGACFAADAPEAAKVAIVA